MFEGKEANVRPQSSLLGGRGGAGATGFKGFDSWAAAMDGEDRVILDGFFSLLSKNGAGVVSQNGVMCTAVWGPERRRRGRKDWGGRREPTLPALGQAQGWGKGILWVFPSGPANRLFTEQGQRAKNMPASSTPSDRLSQGTGWPPGSTT